MKMWNYFIIISAILYIGITQDKKNVTEGDECVFSYTNSLGHCKKVEECESARRDSDISGIKPTFCAYEPFGIVLVCCTDGYNILQSATIKANDERSVWDASKETKKSVSEIEGDDCVFSYTNSIGHCKKAEECESARRDLFYNGVKPTFCKYEPFGAVLVCCTDGNDILQSAAVRDNVESNVWDATKVTNKRVSEIKCEEYSQAVTKTVSFLPLETEDGGIKEYKAPKCKYTGIDLILGGTEAEVGEFPHMAAIGFTDYENNYSFLCAGSLISAKFVLTAAHCSKEPHTRSEEPVIVRLGDHNLDPNDEDGANSIDVPIRKIHIEPNYKSPKKYHDIALLELATLVPFSSGIRPACLWQQDGVGKYSKAIATGWGKTNIRRSAKTSKVLKKVALNLFDNNFCSPLVDFNRHWNAFIDSQMCAGDLDGGNDTCEGDSGGPLQVTSSENKCIFYIMGLTSIGKSCGEKNTPAAYTRISSYIDWIENIVWPK